MKKYLLLIFVLFLGVKGISQVTTQFIPEIDGRNVQGLFNVKIINSDVKLLAYLKIEVSSVTSRKICEIRTNNFTINRGLNLIPIDAVKNAKYQFANNNEGKLLSKTGVIPNGEISYCYTIVVLDQFVTDNIIKPVIDEIENCFDAEIIPFSQLSLSAPYDEDSICESRPVFSWLPSIPMVSSASYKLICSEIKRGQTAVEALKYNLAFINISGIQAPVLPFPPNIRPLETGKNFAWQVIQYKDNVIINKSEVWTFSVQCDELIQESKANNNIVFRQVEDLKDGNFEVVDGMLRFSFNNPYTERELNYQIIPVIKSNKKLKDLPKINLLKGLNLIQIDLTKKGFNNGEEYLLNVDLGNSDIKTLRFKYEAK